MFEMFTNRPLTWKEKLSQALNREPLLLTIPLQIILGWFIHKEQLENAARDEAENAENERRNRRSGFEWDDTAPVGYVQELSPQQINEQASPIDLSKEPGQFKP